MRLLEPSLARDILANTAFRSTIERCDCPLTITYDNKKPDSCVLGVSVDVLLSGWLDVLLDARSYRAQIYYPSHEYFTVIVYGDAYRQEEAVDQEGERGEKKEAQGKTGEVSQTSLHSRSRPLEGSDLPQMAKA